MYNSARIVHLLIFTEICTPVGTRTPNRLIRSQVLYPIELRAQKIIQKLITIILINSKLYPTCPDFFIQKKDGLSYGRKKNLMIKVHCKYKCIE